MWICLYFILKIYYHHNTFNKYLLYMLSFEKFSPFWDFQVKNPIWFMRQSGRYLPKYQELRKKYPHFIDFCLTPDAMVQATQIPFDYFDLDAAIIFSDILIVPYAAEQTVDFIPGKGPQLSQFHLKSYQKDPEDLFVKCEPVYHAIRKTRDVIPPTIPLFGFAGAPWTLMSYSLGLSRHEKVKEDDLDTSLIWALRDALVALISHHLIKQIDAGANMIQIFDSWAATVPDRYFYDLVVTPTKKIVQTVQKHAPHIPILCFPKGIGEKYLPYIEAIPTDGLSIDNSVSMPWVVRNLKNKVVLQTGPTPESLILGGGQLLEEADKILQALSKSPFIFNLTHGIKPQTPIGHVKALVEFVKHAG